ncbi:IS1096 element passenger TnpR family protein [Lentibacillus juripiscarius]|uniref:Plasmid pRiA4b Orf3-like domain-containing protein n=1 Tax=Lentibacillus juripiscarius TaxID=257446 RepID=A0ABW5V901_9BACI
MATPRIDGAGTASPEDVGALPSYYDFLEVYHDEMDPDHVFIKEWAEEQLYR